MICICKEYRDYCSRLAFSVILSFFKGGGGEIIHVKAPSVTEVSEGAEMPPKTDDIKNMMLWIMLLKINAVLIH